MSTVTIPPPACMLRPLEAPLRYLFGPGPSNVPPRILTAGAKPIIGHMHGEMFEVIFFFWKTLKVLSVCVSFCGTVYQPYHTVT